MPIFLAILQILVATIPWQTIFANLINAWIAHSNAKIAAGQHVEVAKTLGKVSEAFAIASANLNAKVEAAQLPSVPADEQTVLVNNAVQDALNAWSNQQPTPDNYKAIFRQGNTDTKEV